MKKSTLKKKIDDMVLAFAERLENAQTIRDKKTRGEKLLKLHNDVTNMKSPRYRKLWEKVEIGGALTGLGGVLGLFGTTVYGVVTADMGPTDPAIFTGTLSSVAAVPTGWVVAKIGEKVNNLSERDVKAVREKLLKGVDAGLRVTFDRDPSEIFNGENAARVRTIFNIAAPKLTPEEEVSALAAEIRQKGGLEN